MAIKLYQRLVELGYNSGEVWNNLALCSFSLRQYHTFYSCFQRALRLSEDDPDILSDIWYNIGNIYSTLGDLDMAKQAYNLSLGHLPDNTEALNNLAVITFREGKTDWAINYAEKSFRVVPNFEACYNLSIWYFQGSQFEKSNFYNKETLRLYPQHLESKELQKRLRNKLDFLGWV